MACASFTTSYGRSQIIRQSQAIRDWSIKNKGYDAYVYSDTDSIHALLDDRDVEQLGQKCYMEEWPDGSVNVTVAGLPKKLSHVVNFDNFKIGFTTAGLSDDIIGEQGRKLTYKHVKGGVILTETDFTIK